MVACSGLMSCGNLDQRILWFLFLFSLLAFSSCSWLLPSSSWPTLLAPACSWSTLSHLAWLLAREQWWKMDGSVVLWCVVVLWAVELELVSNYEWNGCWVLASMTPLPLSILVVVLWCWQHSEMHVWVSCLPAWVLDPLICEASFGWFGLVHIWFIVLAFQVELLLPSQWCCTEAKLDVQTDATLEFYIYTQWCISQCNTLSSWE